MKLEISVLILVSFLTSILSLINYVIDEPNGYKTTIAQFINVGLWSS